MTRIQSIEQTHNDLLSEGAVLCVRLGPDVSLVDACRAAVRGGIGVLEVTLTTPGALEAIAALANDGDAIVGGGTVLSPAEARAVAEAGGRFVFSPVFQPEVIDAAHELGLLAIPGAASATEILAAYNHGARMVKVFPAGALGGASFIRAVRGPLPDVPLVPTSGPNAGNLDEYFAAGAAMVGVGSAEVFPKGFTFEVVEAAAGRVRAAVDQSRKKGR